MKKGFKVGVVAADTFRPGAVTQLKTMSQLVGVDVYSDEKQKDSVKVAEAGKRFFEEGGKNLIIIDTAGRHKEEQSLLDEMSSIFSKVKPDLNLARGRRDNRPAGLQPGARPSTRRPRWEG